MKPLGQLTKSLLSLANSDEFIWLEKYYNQKTIFDILEVSRNENCHSSFIAWLLNNVESHGLDDFPLRKLLETLCLVDVKYTRDSLLNTQLEIDQIIAGTYELSEISVRREKPLRKRRCDVYISLRITYQGQLKKSQTLDIIVENKIFSSERISQTLDYEKSILEDSKFEKHIFIYLTPLQQLNFKENLVVGTSQCGSEQFLPLNYQFFLDGVLEPCLKLSLSNNIRLYIEDYIRCLSRPSILLEKDKEVTNRVSANDYHVMAIRKIHKQKMSDLWNEYKESIFEDMLTLSNNPSNIEKTETQLLESFYRAHLRLFIALFSVLLLDENLKQSDKDMILKKVNDKSLIFEGKTYERGGRRKNSYGYLALNLISTYVNNATEDFIDFRFRLQKMDWLSPWLDEIMVDKNEQPKNKDHYFLEPENILKCKDSTEFFVARYWLYEDVKNLASELSLTVH